MKRRPMVYTKENHQLLKLKIKDFFNEKLSTEESVFLLQDLVDTGLAWQLGEDVKVLATAMLKEGSISCPPSGFMGVKLPSLYEQMTQKKYVF